MTIAAILAGVPAAPLPGLLAGGPSPGLPVGAPFPGLLAGGPMPVDGFAGLLAAALPMPAAETAPVLPLLPVADAPATAGDGAAVPAGTAMPIIEVMGDAGPGDAPPLGLAPALAAPVQHRVPIRLAAAAPESNAAPPAAGRTRGLPKPAPPPGKIVAEAMPAPVEAVASIGQPPAAPSIETVPVLRPALGLDAGDDRGGVRSQAVEDGALQALRFTGAADVASVDADPAPTVVFGVGEQPPVRFAGVGLPPVPVVAAPVALAPVEAGWPDATAAVVGAISATMPPTGLRHARLVPAALDDSPRDALIGVAPAGPPTLSPAMPPSQAAALAALPARDDTAPPALRVSAAVLPTGPMAMPAASGDGADNLAGASSMPPPAQDGRAPLAQDRSAPLAQGVSPMPAVVSPVSQATAVAATTIVGSPDTLAIGVASTLLQPVMTQAPTLQPGAGMAARPADAASPVEARSPGVGGSAPARIGQAGPALAGTDDAATGANGSRVVAAPAEPAQSGGDDRGSDRRDGRDRPMRGRVVAAGLVAPVEPGRPQPMPAAFAPPMAAERAAVPAAPAASMPGPVVSAPSDRAAMTVTTEQLGAVSIGIDDDAGPLRVRLSGSALAMETVAAQAPRLIAELAATGVRLGSLDIAGRVDSAQVPGGSAAAWASAGDATSDQRAASGQPGADAFMGAGADARGQPSGDRRARSAAGIAALARGGIAGDPLAARRFSPSDRYA